MLKWVDLVPYLCVISSLFVQWRRILARIQCVWSSGSIYFHLFASCFWSSALFRFSFRCSTSIWFWFSFTLPLCFSICVIQPDFSYSITPTLGQEKKSKSVTWMSVLKSRLKSESTFNSIARTDSISVFGSSDYLFSCSFFFYSWLACKTQ